MAAAKYVEDKIVEDKLYEKAKKYFFNRPYGGGKN